jgi:pimeloyl-ACP methyl ester carboxylesterase
MRAMTVTAPFADRFWTAPDGLALHARDYAAASGPARAPVICIHGLTRNARDFEALAPRLAAGLGDSGGRRVLAVDVRGRGASAWDPDPSHYVPPVYAGDILALMDGLAIARAIFIGTSMGGLITLLIAAMRPSAVAGAVLNDVGPELAPEGLARIGGYVGGGGPIPDWDAAAAYARQLNEVAFPAYGPADWMAFARRIFTDKSGRPVLDYDPGISAAFKKPGPGEEPPPPPDLWPLFSELSKTPLATIRGATSDILSPAIAEHMRLGAPNMAYTEVEGVGHAPMLDEPQALAAIDALLRMVP